MTHYGSIPQSVLRSHQFYQLARIPLLFDAVLKETKRLRTQVDLIASESFLDPAVLAAAGSVFAVKYAEGYARARYYSGGENADAVEQAAIDWAKILFGAMSANVQPHSGACTNRAALATLAANGCVILSMDLAHGGHLSHGAEVTKTARDYQVRRYGVTDKGVIDYDQVRDLAMREPRPKVIIAGGSSIPRQIGYDSFRSIADEVEARLVTDMAHNAGSVVAKLYPNPIDIADLTTSTTQKTMQSGRGGLILSGGRGQEIISYDDKNRPVTLFDRLNKEVFPGQQGGPLMHLIAAKAAGFYLALNDTQTGVSPEFVDLQRRIISNAQAMADEFMSLGYDVISGGTDTHLLVVRLNRLSGLAAQKALYQADISLNRNAVPGDQRPPFYASGIRIGSPFVTAAGMNEGQVRMIVRTIDDVLKSTTEEQLGKPKLNDDILKRAKSAIHSLTQDSPIYREQLEAMEWFRDNLGKL
ncbi:serine hydroxymethyltransferase [Candidatus Pacearchaeota archaeon]|nr:serine hydroxymethyltransferase [Candidatus Pacearchaeota archaeon]